MEVEIGRVTHFYGHICVAVVQLNEDLKLGRGEGLGKIIPRAGPKPFKAALHRRIPRHEDGEGIRGALLGMSEDLHPSGLTHEKVHQEEVELLAIDELQGLVSAAADGHLVPLGGQQGRAAFTKGELVVNDEDGDGLAGGLGKGQGTSVRISGEGRGRGLGPFPCG